MQYPALIYLKKQRCCACGKPGLKAIPWTKYLKLHIFCSYHTVQDRCYRFLKAFVYVVGWFFLEEEDRFQFGFCSPWYQKFLSKSSHFLIKILPTQDKLKSVFWFYLLNTKIDSQRVLRHKKHHENALLHQFLAEHWVFDRLALTWAVGWELLVHSLQDSESKSERVWKYQVLFSALVRGRIFLESEDQN